MLCFFFPLKLHLSLHTKYISLSHSKTLVGFAQILNFSPFTSLSTPINPHPNDFELKDICFIASYLVNSTKFSPEIAKTVSEKLGVKTLENRCQVVKLLKNYGFSETQITKIMVKTGFMLVSVDPEKILRKLEFLLSAGIERSELSMLVCSRYQVLNRSLNNFLIPALNKLKILFPSYGDVGKILIFLSPKDNDGVLKYLPRNVGFLQILGIPQPIIISLNVRRSTEMGFETDNFSFVDAVAVVAGMGRALIADRILFCRFAILW